MPKGELNPGFAVQALDAGIVAAVLRDNAIQPGDALLAEFFVDLDPILDPFNIAVVSVSAPVAFHQEDLVANLRFRLSHDVWADSDNGSATFGRANYGEEDGPWYEPPLADAVAQMSQTLPSP